MEALTYSQFEKVVRVWYANGFAGILDPPNSPDSAIKAKIFDIWLSQCLLPGQIGSLDTMTDAKYIRGEWSRRELHYLTHIIQLEEKLNYSIAEAANSTVCYLKKKRTPVVASQTT